MDNTAMDGIDWRHVLALNVAYTVDSVRGGRFILEMARHIAHEDKSVVRDNAGKILEDYRE